MPRLEPLEPAQWSESTRELLGNTVGTVAGMEGRPAQGARPLNILGTIAHHPKLLPSFLGFAAALALHGELTRRHSELLALRAAWNCRSPFEWAHHAVYAAAAGLSQEEIARVPRGAQAPGWSESERALLLAADQLHASQQLADSTWEVLRSLFSDAQLVEIPFVVGQYTMLSMLANSTGVPVEEGLPALPAG